MPRPLRAVADGLGPAMMPLNLDQFTAALHKGQGRALLHVREFGVAGLEDAIVDACIHDRSYDAQCEGDRTDWLMEILNASGIEARFAEILIPQLGVATDHYWSAAQRCRLARKLAERGYHEARACVYSSLRKWPETMDVIGAADIVALDGAAGLKYVAEWFGGLLQRHPWAWLDDEPLQVFDGRHGSGAGRAILDAAASESPAFAAYLRHFDEREKQDSNDDGTALPANARMDLAHVRLDPSAAAARVKRLQDISAAEVIEKIEHHNPQHAARAWFLGWGRTALEGELTKVFQLMLQETDPGRLRSYLRVFGRRALPVFDDRLLRFAEHADPVVRRFANDALSNYAHPAVRELALRRVKQGGWQENELKLLKLNYQPGDAAVIQPLLRVPEDGELHSLIFDLVQLFRANVAAEGKQAMLFVYEESPCSNCRGDAGKFLVSTGQAPGWLLDECPYDASVEIRALVATGNLSNP